MARAAASTEERTLRALRQASAITGPQLDAALTALTATEPCPKCGGDGIEVEESTDENGVFKPARTCERCAGTGEQYVIR